jgi:Protein of unknown function (DUF3551)
MRILALAILAIATISVTGPARAQKYDPNFPFCMDVVKWGGSTYEDCSFYTLEQCRASASGLGYICGANPYFVGATTSRGRYDRRHRPVY